ncbi:flagellinolysin [Pseudoalteromonas denitrificans]|uniref:Flagellin n=1 Tax=Pseudoalteromonas denitrificans DSM 6059 TaxID=1123010 RepID=A0A1I1HI68_9GAMM|nr:flagellinolysin [Pseudoalteromonas denitrificans]SFC23839.1 flagellin [Pseudoalteromonas denitrificans DSM 6059]
MRITTNISSLFLQRQLTGSSNQLEKSLQKISSGLRINSAADDAAGLQISNRLTSQVNGTFVAMKNANDGISMAQTADGAMAEVTNALNRIRDLSLQSANGTLSNDDRKAIQQEVSQLQTEIDRVNDTTTFGGKKLFGPTGGRLLDIVERDLVKGMTSTWLFESESIIMDQLGLDGLDRTLKIDLEHVDGAGGTAAFVSAATAGGAAFNQVMVIDLDDFNASNLPNGDPAGLELDEVILHEMVHAIQGANFEDWANIPAWFKEGSAEAIRGADSRVANDIAAGGGGTVGIAALWVSAQAEAGSAAVVSTAGAYSGGYIIQRYIHSQIGQAGMKDLNAELATGATLDAALNTASNGTWANEAGLFTALGAAPAAPSTAATVFEDFINTNMDLTNLDNGAFGGFDANGSQAPRRENTMQGLGDGTIGAKSFLETFISGDDDNNATDFDSSSWDVSGNPNIDETRLENYQVEINGGGGRNVSIQVGAGSFETIDFSVGTFSTQNLGLDYIDVVNFPQFAVFAADDALRIIDSSRAQLGAVINRLGNTVNNQANINENTTASRGRIRDTDYATEMTELTKVQIKQQAATSLLAQANQMPQLALSLLQ